MSLNWKSLSPHRPVAPGDPTYVDRPEGGGQRIADLVRSGQSTVLLAGPLGVGKSTELAQAARLLQPDRVSCLVHLGLDRAENMRVITADQVLLRVAGRLATVAIQVLGLDLSADLRAGLVSRGVLSPDLLTAAPGGAIHASPAAFARATLMEVRRLSRQGAVTLLIDGLEKTPEEPSRVVFDALAELPEFAELVLVVPYRAAYGPGAAEVVRPGERLVAVRPVAVVGEPGAAGRAFLSGIVERRLGLSPGAFDDGLGPGVSPAVAAGVREAIHWSDGIPRLFLQLLVDAAAHARLDRGAEWPEVGDVRAAVREQVETTRRLLLPGDSQAIVAGAGSDGRELDLDRKLRLLQNGLLVERVSGGVPVLHMHPFVAVVLGERDRV